MLGFKNFYSNPKLGFFIENNDIFRSAKNNLPWSYKHARKLSYLFWIVQE